MPAITPAFRCDPQIICQFANQLATVQAIAAHGGETGTVFLGDSITQNWVWVGDTWPRTWAPRRALNLGIGGDQPSHLLFRLENGLVAGLKPRAVVQLIGVNACWSRPAPELVADGVETCLRSIRRQLPTVPVLALAILPLADPGLDDLVQRINAMLPERAAACGCDARDFGGDFRAADGSVRAGLLSDGCHLLPEGYRILDAGIRAWQRERGLAD